MLQKENFRYRHLGQDKILPANALVQRNICATQQNFTPPDHGPTPPDHGPQRSKTDSTQPGFANA